MANAVVANRGGQATIDQQVDAFMMRVVAQSPGEIEFHQAVREVVESVMPIVQSNQAYRDAKILDRMVVPENVIMFRVVWTDDTGQVQVNRGYRIRMSSRDRAHTRAACGSIRRSTSGVLKFLAFEQVFKNSLTTLPLGGGKGGSDFDPKGRSDSEVMRFCQAFMTELYRYIGPEIDVPAGDIGVGGREIGFLFGQYRRLTHRFNGTLTGKNVLWGGSNLRPEATGYGSVYFANDMLGTRGESLKGKIADGLRVRQRGPVHRGEAQCPGSESRHDVRFGRHHRGFGRHQRRETGVGHGVEERASRPHQGIRGSLQRRQVPGRQAAVGRPVRSGVPQRHAERDR